MTSLQMWIYRLRRFVRLQALAGAVYAQCRRDRALLIAALHDYEARGDRTAVRVLEQRIGELSELARAVEGRRG